VANATVTVKSSGGDYTSLNAALAGEVADLTANCHSTGGAGILTIECYAFEDTTAASTGTGYTTSANYYINITVPATERHAGKWNTSKYRHKYTGESNNINIQAQHVRISYLQIESPDDSWRFGIRSDPTIANSPYLYVYGCILKPTASTNSNLYGIRSSDDVQLIAYNNLIYGYSSTSSCGIMCRHNSLDCKIYNNTFVNLANAIILEGWGDGDIQNNLFSSCASHGSGYARYNHYNATSSSSFGDLTGEDVGDNDTSVTFTFVDAAGYDFHLASNDAGAKDAGASLSGTFTTDIDGETRSGTWDIGADEYVAACASSTASFQYYFNNARQ